MELEDSGYVKNWNENKEFNAEIQEGIHIIELLFQFCINRLGAITTSAVMIGKAGSTLVKWMLFWVLGQLQYQ